MADDRNGTCLVTGAAGGIGLAVCRRMAAEGFNVVGLDRHPPSGPAEHNDEAIQFERVDLCDTAQLQATVRHALSTRPPLTGICAAAGVRHGSNNLTVAELDLTYEVNVRSVHVLLQLCLPLLASSDRSSVVLIGSPSAVADVNDVAYGASKAAVVSMARSLALLHANNGIRVNVVSPGFTTTTMTEQAPTERRRAAALRNVAGRVNEPADVASAVAWLLLEESITMSGAVVDVGAVSGLPAQATVHRNDPR